MKYQNFIMRILCLLLILAAVVGYNSMQKKDTQAQESQEITALTKRVEKLEEQNTEILSALEEAAKNQEAAIAQAQRDAKDKDDAAKRMRRKLTLQIQKSLMIRKMYTEMVRIPVPHRDLAVRSPYRSHLQMMRSQIFR